MLTYWYPADFMLVLTIASAISRISFSLTLQPNLFQLFQPITGVGASKACRAVSVVCAAEILHTRNDAERIKIRNVKKRGDFTAPRSLLFLLKECGSTEKETNRVPHPRPLCHTRSLELRKRSENQLYSFRHECTNKPTLPLFDAVLRRYYSAHLRFPLRARPSQSNFSGCGRA